MAQARWAQKPAGFATVKRGGWWVRPQAALDRLPSGSRLPDGPRGVGQFVREHYAPAQQAGAYRKLLATGDTFTPAKGKTPPRGGTTASTTRSAARNKLLPREYVGSPGVIGSWKKEPRLSPEAYEWTVNPDTGRWFARPRTETTGLDPQQKADLSAFDRTTAATQAQVGDIYSRYATQAGADRDAAAQAFGTLSKLSSAGFSDTISGQASGPYGAVQGPALSQAERALPGVLAQGARETSAAQSGQSLFALSQLPTLARDAGATAQQSLLASRQGQRAEFLSSARQTAAEAAAAAEEAQFNRQKLAAELRGQNISLLGDKIGAKTTIDTAKIRATTATLDREAKIKASIATLNNRLQIAREGNLVSRANTLEKQIAKREEALAKERRKKNERRRDVVRRNAQALGLAQQLRRGQANSDGTRTIYTFAEIVQNIAANFDMTPAEAEKVVRRAGARPGTEIAGGLF